jgi:hypothetical protein
MTITLAGHTVVVVVKITPVEWLVVVQVLTTGTLYNNHFDIMGVLIFTARL